MIPSLEEWPTKAKEASSPHEVKLTMLDTNPALVILFKSRLLNIFLSLLYSLLQQLFAI